MNQPFNGQLLRLRTVRALTDSFEPDAFIETGTFLGSTTRFFCGNGVPVFTIELKPLFRVLARSRLGWNRDVFLLGGDSRSGLAQLARRDSFVRPFVYLDAHWWNEVPLDEELALVFKSWVDAIAVVDDFKVDADPGYAFDTYKGTSLALADILLPDGVMIAVPAQPSAAETGARRGTLYVAKGPRAERTLTDIAERGLVRLL